MSTILSDTQGDIRASEISADHKTTRIVAFGATGSTGRHVVDQSLFAGHDVAAVVRQSVNNL